MNGLADLLARLASLDVRLALDGERLSVNAPKGALTVELRDELARRKEELKAHLGAAQDDAVTRAALAPVPRRAHMPVSHTQQRLWFLRQMNPGSSTYNLPNAFRMSGTLDVGALEFALAELVRRHESLRTRFFGVEGVPHCSVEPEAAVTLRRVDLSHLPEAAREEAALGEILAGAREPFDLDAAPLLRTTLVRLQPELHLFCFVVDHIVADGISLGVFFLELQALYTERAGGPRADLPPLPVQYLDYADWQRRALADGAQDEHLAYWRRRLHGLPPVLSLPTDRPRPPVQSFNGARTVMRLPPELATELKALARREHATLYMVLLAAFEVLLHRQTGEHDFAVGSVVAARDRPEVERVIGFFANNIVQRADLSGDPTVRELLARVREGALQAYAHQDVPFDLLVEKLSPRRDLDHAPLFQVLFVLHTLLLTRADFPGLVCEPLELPVTSARFDLAVDVFDLPDSLRVIVEYNTDLFDASTISRLQDQLARLLRAFVDTPDARIGSLPLLGPAERHRLLVEWNDTRAPLPREQTVHGLFERQAARRPDATAVVFEDTRLDYRELNARANRLAHHLRSMGVGRESLVGVSMQRSDAMVVAMLGILKAGGAYVPLDPAFPKDRIDFMIEDAALQVVVTQDALAGSLPATVRTVRLDGDAARLAACPSGDPPPLAGPTDLAYTIYTSGSTGRPKGVQIEHHSVVNFLLGMHREPGIAEDDRFVSVTTLSFDIAGLEIHGPLTAGGTVVLASRATALDGVALARLLDASGATLFQATPATWRLLLETGWRGRAGLRMLCGGEAMPRELAQALLALGGELWNMYGPTETTIWSTLHRVRDAARTAAIGRPMANTQVYVLEPSGLPAPLGVAGELCIGGEGVARGYRNPREPAADKFVTLDLPEVGRTRVYRTGDLVRWRADGQLEFIGRRDHQVKLRGFRIELAEIESVLATHPGVKENVVLVRQDTPGDQRLVGYVVPVPAGRFDAEAARATLRAKLPEYMVPGQFVVLDALPLTPNGKVDRKALPAPQAADAGAAAEDATDALMTPVERRVAAQWSAVLGTERVGLHANFFDLGGHSLLLVRLQSALQREFGEAIPLVELFQRTTVHAQAERLAAPRAVDQALKRAQARAARQIQD